MPYVKLELYSHCVVTRGSFHETVRSQLREQLLDAARDALIAGGWNQLRMVDIANQVGVSRQTVYNEFGNKTRVGEAIAMREAERFLVGIGDQLDEHPEDLVKAIHVAVEFTLAEAADNPLLKAVLTATRGGANELLPFVTSRSAPILVSATAVLTSYLDENWPDIQLDHAHRRMAVEAVVRLVVSHLVMPLAPPEETARTIAWLTTRVLWLPDVTTS